MYCISSCAFRLIISQVSLVIPGASYNIHLVDENVLYEEFDYTDIGKSYDININEIRFYLPDNHSKKTCFVYFPYGNYKIHEDMTMHE